MLAAVRETEVEARVLVKLSEATANSSVGLSVGEPLQCSAEDGEAGGDTDVRELALETAREAAREELEQREAAFVAHRAEWEERRDATVARDELRRTALAAQMTESAAKMQSELAAEWDARQAEWDAREASAAEARAEDRLLLKRPDHASVPTTAAKPVVVNAVRRLDMSESGGASAGSDGA